MSPAEVLAVLAASGVEIGRPASVEPIKHGLTNASWLVRGSADTVVVRLSNTDEDSLQIDRVSEATIMALVAGQGIGPEVIHSDPARHLLVTRYAGVTWSDADAAEPSHIDRVAALLGRLHGLPLPTGIRQVELLSVVDGYLRTLDVHGAAFDVSVPKLRVRAREVAASLRHQPEIRLCHNDVHALNIVDDGTLRLIDWEYAGLGERLFDLASICVYQKYDKARRERLLHAYEAAVMLRRCLGDASESLAREIPGGGNPRRGTPAGGGFEAQAGQPQSGPSWHRLELCCWLFDYVRDLWTAVREIR